MLELLMAAMLLLTPTQQSEYDRLKAEILKAQQEAAAAIMANMK